MWSFGIKGVLLLCCVALALHSASAVAADGSTRFVDNGGAEICKNEIGPVDTLFTGTGPNALPSNVTIAGGSCTHFYRGVDITGVLNRFLFSDRDGINNACDCVRTCMAHIGVCTNWAWKFTGSTTGPAGGVPSDARTCTIYSNFAYPRQVSIGYNLTGSTNAAGQLTTGVFNESLSNDNQFGQLRPFQIIQQGASPSPCTFNNGTGFDSACLSGAMFLYADNTLVC